MMSLSPGALNAGQAETYFEQHYSHDDYYSEGHRTIGQWIGKGAAELGLAGDVSFSRLLNGIDPRSGETLVPHASHNDKRDAGWDATFNAPKSISVQALVGGDHRLFAAHERAMQRTIAEVEAFALAHQKGGSELVVSGNIVGAAFTHFAARPTLEADRKPDPQLHSHVVLLNLTHRPDGEWRSLRPIEIYRSQIFGSAVYRAELAREVQNLGYRIEATPGKHGAWELAGYSREHIEAFSQRRLDIEKVMAEKGVNHPKAAQIIALQTRQSKKDYDENDLKAEWQQRAADHGIDTRQIRREAWQRGPLLHNANGFTAREAVSFGLAHTTEREAVIDRRALEAAALEHGMGRVDLDGVRRR
jgi:conjugative relaxase-like TrwC/TraI family protein